MNNIALISCTKQKQTYTCEAEVMYQPSTLYTKINRYIQNMGFDEMYILSAKYGLLDKNKIIDPYDVTMLNMKSNDRKKWADKVFQELKKKISRDNQIYIFAGEKYRQYLIPKLEDAGYTCHIPLKGMQIGEQLQFLSNQLKEGNQY